MVTLNLFLRKKSLIIAAIVLASCNRQAKRQTQLSYVKYVAHRNGDTAIAMINKDAKIFSGSLNINHGGDNVDSGEVKGIVRGDTMIGEFHFFHYQLMWKRKPIAFLVKNDSLIMGDGITKLTVGIPHFDPTVPINFDEKKQLVFKKVYN